MARAKSERARSKTHAIDDLTQSIEQLQSFLPTVEDLGREGFPYLEGARARTELQLRECIKRAFGDKSPEFQTHRQHKLSETKQTAALIRNLIASLEDKKLELQGLKPPAPEPAAPRPEPARPTMTLVSPSTTSAPAPSVITVTPSPAMHVGLTAGKEQAGAAIATGSHPSMTAAPVVPTPSVPAAPVAPVPAPTVTAPTAKVSAAPPAPAAAPPPQPVPPRAPIEPISSLFRTQEIKPMPPVPEQTAPPPPPPPQPMVAAKPPAAPFSTTQEVPPQPSISQAVAPSAHAPLSASNALSDTEHLPVTKKLCQRFHFVARQLRLRGEYRSSVSVEDELDVQDLLHALLRLQFDDISTDEWIPAYTNGAARTTFLLNHDRLAVVAKKTRAGLTVKDLTDQVRADIERYRARGRCTNLLAFIYDPDGRIGNPRGVESELASISEQFAVDIVVAPK